MSTTVCLTFNFDALSVWAGGFGLATPQFTSRARFGAEVATPRILDFLKTEDIRATWFVAGSDAELYPEQIRRIRDEGHEIAHHGWKNEDLIVLDGAAETEALERGLETLDRVADIRPRGYRAPNYDLSARTPQLLLDHGFDWDSTLMARDFEMYRLRSGDRISVEEPIVFGQPTPLVEVPISWTLNDFYLMEMVMLPQMILPGSVDTEALSARWREDLDFCDSEVTDGVFTPIFHPQTIGRGSKLDMLRSLVHHAREIGSPFRTISEAANAWSSTHPLRQKAESGRTATEEGNLA